MGIDLQNRGSQVQVLSPLLREAPAPGQNRSGGRFALPASNPGLVTDSSPDDEIRASLRRVRWAAAKGAARVLAGAIAAAAVVVLVAPAPADAHEITRAQCADFARTTAFVTGMPARGARAGRACRIAAARHLLEHPLPDAMIPAELRRIRGCESGTGRHGRPNYRAENPTTTASGAYQYLDTTWGVVGIWEHAADAPPRVQDERALRDWRRSSAPWNSSKGCWG